MGKIISHGQDHQSWARSSVMGKIITMAADKTRTDGSLTPDGPTARRTCSKACGFVWDDA
jgi:hypothetical protein